MAQVGTSSSHASSERKSRGSPGLSGTNPELLSPNPAARRA